MGCSELGGETPHHPQQGAQGGVPAGDGPGQAAVPQDQQDPGAGGQREDQHEGPQHRRPDDSLGLHSSGIFPQVIEKKQSAEVEVRDQHKDIVIGEHEQKESIMDY